MERIYNDDFLKLKTKAQLNELLEKVKRNDGGLTQPEQKKNIEKLEYFISGGASLRDKAIIADMEAGQADISDIGGMN